ncbi:MAG: ATP-dependent RecD-like DNA helicase [Fibrobacter sp.]|nr:ATP-dependent RecD-like DNA helicase [Fibrobacter sp.]
MELKGAVKSVTFHNPQNGFTVLRLSEESSKKVVVVTGTFPALNVGEILLMEGEWGRHPRYGQQFQSTRFKIEQASDGGDMVAYLSSGLFPGIGQKTAQAIVDKFGDETADILDFDPVRFASTKIRGLPSKKIPLFLARWQENRHGRETMLFLYSNDITGAVAKKIWMRFGQDTIETIRTNPYILCEEIWGIGFLKADEIAMKLGFAKDSPMRLQEALLYTLQEAAINDGHCYLPKDALLQRTIRNLRLEIEDDASVDMLLEHFEKVCHSERIRCIGEDCFHPALYRAEQAIADNITRRLTLNDLPVTNFDKALVDWEREHKFAFDPIQREAIGKALAHKIFIITGGPGTGKTTIIKGIIHLARKMDESICLAAPTGRAAKRMGDVCGENASTLHRLLEVDPVTKKFKKNADNKIQCKLLIVDEFSMVDTWLAASLLDAVPFQTRIVLVGDADQLPSVGPGNILNDLLCCPQIPHVKLQHIFRQSGGNDIAEKASKINQGIVPSPPEGPNFHFVPYETPEEGRLLLQKLIATGVRSKIDVNLIEDLQILSPMRKGPMGIFELNPYLQDLLNPDAERKKILGTAWSEGDRVMQMRNNYDKNVFNGDVGIIWRIRDKKITVMFDDKNVEYEGDEIEDLSLAYVTTIHKSQGSEYPAVIVILDSSHYVMLQRNLIYTAITRAKGHVWILSAPGAFYQAVRNSRSNKRFTRLTERITEPAVM